MQLTQDPYIGATTPIVTATSLQYFVAIDKPIFVKFNRDMDGSTITAATFFIPNVSGTVRYDALNRIAYFQPAAPLAANSAFKPTVSTAVKDMAGKNLVKPYTFLVETRSTPNTSTPSVHWITQDCVSPSGVIQVMFSEQMNSSTITTSSFFIDGVTGTVTYDGATRIATFTPNAPLTPGQSYNPHVTTAATDLGGIHLGANYNFTFDACNVNNPGSFCSYTKGGYQGGGVPGQFFDANFATVFAGDLTIGINDGAGSQHSARWTSLSPGPENLKSYLTSPAGGASAGLASDYINLAATNSGQLSEQTVALTLNVYFSGVAGMPAGFGNQILTGTGTSLDGASISDILAFTNSALAGNGLPTGYTFSTLNDLVTNLNESWDDCTESGWGSTHLTHPAPLTSTH